MNSQYAEQAPGWPGIEPKWTSSAKSGVGAALSNRSRIWYTLSHGILNEVYYPRIDQACIRDMGLIVTDGVEFFPKKSATPEARSAIPIPASPCTLCRMCAHWDAIRSKNGL